MKGWSLGWEEVLEGVEEEELLESLLPVGGKRERYGQTGFAERAGSLADRESK